MNALLMTSHHVEASETPAYSPMPRLYGTQASTRSLGSHFLTRSFLLAIQNFIMSSSPLAIDGLKSSAVIESVASRVSKMSEAEKKAQMKKINGVFQLNVKGSNGKEGQWTIDFKKEGKVYLGPAKPKADVTIALSDDVLQSVADGKLGSQKAFMSGQLKVKGNVMLATKLDMLLKASKSKL
ncbi:hypothetical protein O181_066266 [Austropuccinia psidii MF-1]|uniref:SCP2 domain-containing protein n=1 Tax=Austropuccinia psidii MF-1 TaxID=1389203 RepID=A0A9Q3EXA5_9BASI|nr:hypothetical protein [Austropuccinia psidii MF-1]